MLSLKSEPRGVQDGISNNITGTLNGLPLRTVSTNQPVEFTLTVRHSHTSTPRGEGVTVADRTKHL